MPTVSALVSSQLSRRLVPRGLSVETSSSRIKPSSSGSLSITSLTKRPINLAARSDLRGDMYTNLG